MRLPLSFIRVSQSSRRR
jgi:hypothetical protein